MGIPLLKGEAPAPRYRAWTFWRGLGAAVAVWLWVGLALLLAGSGPWQAAGALLVALAVVALLGLRALLR